MEYFIFKHPIPPLILAIILALSMKAIAYYFFYLTLPSDFHFWFAILFSILGLIPLIGGIYLVIMSRTTVDPTAPENSSTLVTKGIYRYTRNPMYLGFLLCLIGWSLWLENILTISGAMIFYWYINRHQIPFEEKALAEKFTAKYQQYCRNTRRWL